MDCVLKMMNFTFKSAFGSLGTAAAGPDGSEKTIGFDRSATPRGGAGEASQGGRPVLSVPVPGDDDGGDVEHHSLGSISDLESMSEYDGLEEQQVISLGLDPQIDLEGWGLLEPEPEPEPEPGPEPEPEPAPEPAPAAAAAAGGRAGVSGGEGPPRDGSRQRVGVGLRRVGGGGAGGGAVAGGAGGHRRGGPAWRFPGDPGSAGGGEPRAGAAAAAAALAQCSRNARGTGKGPAAAARFGQSRATTLAARGAGVFAGGDVPDVRRHHVEAAGARIYNIIYNIIIYNITYTSSDDVSTHFSLKVEDFLLEN